MTFSLSTPHRQLAEDPSRYPSPIYSLPLDVLTDIFLAFVPIPSNYGVMVDYNSLDISQGAWLLSHVCSAWRAIVFRMHTLWSLVSPSLTMQTKAYPSHSDMEKAQENFCARTIQLLATQLHRAGGAPLTISLISGPSTDLFKLTLDLLSHYSEQWVDLRVSCTPELVRHLDMTAKPIKGYLPILQKIFLTTQNEPPQSIMEVFGRKSSSVIKAFEYTPGLLEVVLLTSDASTALFELPWAQLSSYEVDTRVREQLALLYTATNLEVCTISLNDNEELRLINPSFIVSPKLRMLRFTLGKEHMRSAATLLNALRLPALEHFELDSEVEEAWDSDLENRMLIQALISLFRRSACPLTTLCLPDIAFTSEEFRELLEVLPLVENLQITVEKILDASHLTYSREKPKFIPLAPRLKVLSLEVTDEICCETVIQMMESRYYCADLPTCSTMTRLQGCFLIIHSATWFPQLKSKYMCHLERMKREGLYIRLYLPSLEMDMGEEDGLDSPQLLMFDEIIFS